MLDRTTFNDCQDEHVVDLRSVELQTVMQTMRSAAGWLNEKSQDPAFINLIAQEYDDLCVISLALELARTRAEREYIKGV